MWREQYLQADIGDPLIGAQCYVLRLQILWQSIGDAGALTLVHPADTFVQVLWRSETVTNWVPDEYSGPSTVRFLATKATPLIMQLTFHFITKAISLLKNPQNSIF